MTKNGYLIQSSSGVSERTNDDMILYGDIMMMCQSVNAFFMIPMSDIFFKFKIQITSSTTLICQNYIGHQPD
ncbi:hypothetical protein DERP_009503 [Dermatophagoides pteronyssinus]|uniref:Uncharacterized protein n=1 Tax=Dermatophagoides pteronyssinus TaxID=6956 RepID=A0ABQ8IUB9_DERPT|nr:hypothetical protein DERP_009503 [Dermatophagoides pteronyssinus]